MYTPGSIFKVVTTTCAVENMPDVQSFEYECSGQTEIDGVKITCPSTHGKMNFKECLANSCNCAFAELALQLGPEKMEHYAESFGVIAPVTFDGIETPAGNYEASNAPDIDIGWSGAGQYNDLVNPCSFLTFVGAIANGGQGVRPYLVASVGNYQAQTTAMDRILSEETASVLQEFMRNNVVNNYGDENFPGFTVCAKSGTGQVGGELKANAMFAGFVADEAYPLAFVVAVEEGGYGRTTCVPIIAKVLKSCTDVMDRS